MNSNQVQVTPGFVIALAENSLAPAKRQTKSQSRLMRSSTLTTVAFGERCYNVTFATVFAVTLP
jgi:hypothetical protein